MSVLDDVLQKFNDNPEEGQHAFYETVLNTIFYIPLRDDPSEEKPEKVAPLILESDDKGYLMMFDSEERLNAWAGQEVPHTTYPGFQLAEMSPEGLYWALNVGSEQTKEFIPEEIDMLKQAVAAYNESLK